MKIQKRLEKAREAGAQYIELAKMYEAAITGDVAKLKEFRISPSAAIRFATFCNRYVEISLEDLDQDFFIKFAAIFNPSTPAEVLDQIGLHHSHLNPVIPETLVNHGKASMEVKAFLALTENKKDYEVDEEEEKFFIEAIYDNGDGKWVYGESKEVLDLEILESLIYLYILGFIEAPPPASMFWDYIYEDNKTVNKIANIELFGKLPTIPESLPCDTVVGARCIAGSMTTNVELMRELCQDRHLIYTGVGGNWWQDTRSPRSSVASNKNAPADLLRTIFHEETQDEDGLSEFPHPVFWRLSCNPVTPQDVLEGIIKLIENETISDEMTQEELLIGHKDDYPYGLATNPVVKGELRNRVNKLLIKMNLEPEEHQPQ